MAESDFSWGAIGAVIAALGGGLDSLANGTLSGLGSEYDNTAASTFFQSGTASIQMASAAFVAPSYITLYSVQPSQLTGGTYSVMTSAAAAALSNYSIGTVYINGSTAIQYETLANVLIPAGKTKYCGLTGGSTPTLGTGNIVNIWPTPTRWQ